MTSRTDIVAPQLSDEHWAALHASQAAEAAGDPVEALRLYDEVPHFRQSLHRSRLALLIDLGDDAPGWMWSRWMTEQAKRSLSRATGSWLDRLIDVAYPHGVDTAFLETSAGVGPGDVVAALLSRDWVLRQLLVYEEGGLRDLVAHRAGPGLLRRADRIADWVDAPMGGFRLESDVDDCVQVTDLASGERIDLLDLGVAFEHWPGDHLLGRVVPTSAGPGRMFEWQPMHVDAGTAQLVADVAHEPGAWVGVIRARARADLLPDLFSYLEEPSMVLDLEQRFWLAVLDGKDIATLPTRDGLVAWHDASFLVLERLLTSAARIGPRIAVARHAVFALVLDLDLRERVRAELVRPERSRGWRILGSVVAEPARARCRALAEAGDAWVDEAS